MLIRGHFVSYFIFATYMQHGDVGTCYNGWWQVLTRTEALKSHTHTHTLTMQPAVFINCFRHARHWRKCPSGMPGEAKCHLNGFCLSTQLCSHGVHTDHNHVYIICLVYYTYTQTANTAAEVLNKLIIYIKLIASLYATTSCVQFSVQFNHRGLEIEQRWYLLTDEDAGFVL